MCAIPPSSKQLLYRQTEICCAIAHNAPANLRAIVETLNCYLPSDMTTLPTKAPNYPTDKREEPVHKKGRQMEVEGIMTLTCIQRQN